MIFGEFETSAAAEIILAHDIKVEKKTYKKDYKLNSEDIDFLKEHNIQKVFGCKVETGDITSEAALEIIAANISSKNIAYGLKDVHKCEIIADSTGIVVLDQKRINKFNNHSKYVKISNIAPYSHIKKNNVIAMIYISSPVVSHSEISELIASTSGSGPLFKIEESKKSNICFIQTSSNASNIEKAFNIKSNLEEALKNTKAQIIDNNNVIYDINSITEAINKAVTYKPEIIFIHSEYETCHDFDVIPLALNQSFCEIDIFNSAISGLNNLIIATHKSKTNIIVLPKDFENNYDEIEKISNVALSKNLIDFEKITQICNQSKFNSYKTKIEKEKIYRPSDSKKKQKNVATVILAAGLSNRFGSNKLLQEIKGKTMIERVVNTALQSDSSPVYVVTGYQSEKIEEIIQDKDVKIIHNPSYQSGVKTSIDIGVQALPETINGVIILPADMPNIKKENINSLIEEFETDKTNICISSNNGIKSNPVLWHRNLFKNISIIPENAMFRPILVEHSDYTKMVKSAKNTLIDINTNIEFEENIK